MEQVLSQQALDQLFYQARTVNAWQDKPVSDELLTQLYDVFKWGPTSANSCPARFVWVKSDKAKQTLADLAKGGNPDKILQAPVTVIIGQDLNFVDTLPKLVAPHLLENMQNMLRPVAEITAFRNGTLQGAYLMMAARALGLDCGPMSGFDNDGVDKAFFADTAIKSNFICCLGYGVAESTYPRAPRLSFDEAGEIV
ncbi:malonic semialdehyde reductase [Neptunicella marina]|uniref:Malonic semialdehyde reductase n=1 Tax=Neptunicella marina TaxID=2125989 RepID=A0A8J6M0A6_9ALTE|nr:malonic semialdehyde reductase [Neptunicella marina]